MSHQRQARHTRSGDRRQADGTFWVWHTTRPRPWDRKKRQRRRSKLARVSRRKNR